MIYYRCKQCGVLLETDDSLAGQRERCPNCRSQNDVPVGKQRHRKKQSRTDRQGDSAATTTKRTSAFADTAAGNWTRAQTWGFILFMLFGVPLLRTMCNSSGRRATSSQHEPMATTAMVAQGGVYSETRGTGGDYRDPMNGYFQVQPPADWQIVEKRDKGTFTFGLESAHPGRVAPRSWIVFRRDHAEIGVIARESYRSIEEDFPLVLKGYRERFGGNVKDSRFITIDGVKGGEVLASIKGMQVLLVKYKKNGLDHAITMTCPLSDSRKFAPEFEQFLRSYRSLNNTSVQTRMQGDY